MRRVTCRFSPAANYDENAGGRRQGNAPARECFVPGVLRLAKAVAPLPPMSAPLSSLERVHVAVRRRPPFSREATHLSALRMEPPQSGELARVDLNESSSVSGGVVREYRFDAVFDYSSKQKELYVEMGRPIVASALAGVNGCVLAYGQTGTGKTYTMGLLGTLSSALGVEGPSSGAVPRLSSTAGVVPRALYDVFNKVESDHESGAARWAVSISLAQLYNDSVFDLFSPKWTEAQRRGDAAEERRSTERREQTNAQRRRARGRPRRRMGEHIGEAAQHTRGWNGRTHVDSSIRRRRGGASAPTAASSSRGASTRSSGGRAWSAAAAAAAHANAPAPLRIHEDAQGWFYPKGQLEYDVVDLAEAAELLDWGLANRSISSTSLNLTSSRSHTMVTLRLTRTDPRGARIESKLLLVDLAGSERLQSQALLPRGMSPGVFLFTVTF